MKNITLCVSLTFLLVCLFVCLAVCLVQLQMITISKELLNLNSKIDGIVMFLDLDLNTECETQE